MSFALFIFLFYSSKNISARKRTSSYVFVKSLSFVLRCVEHIMYTHCIHNRNYENTQYWWKKMRLRLEWHWEHGNVRKSTISVREREKKSYTQMKTKFHAFYMCSWSWSKSTLFDEKLSMCNIRYAVRQIDFIDLSAKE